MIRFYHNPRCSKSRAALELLQQNGAEITLIDYLRHPPSEEELSQLIDALGIPPEALLRKGEAEYEALNLSDITLERKHLLAAMHAHPKLIERPLAWSDDGRAVIGRPPENVLSLLK